MQKLNYHLRLTPRRLALKRGGRRWFDCGELWSRSTQSSDWRGRLLYYCNCRRHRPYAPFFCAPLPRKCEPERPDQSGDGDGSETGCWFGHFRSKLRLFKTFFIPRLQPGFFAFTLCCCCCCSLAGSCPLKPQQFSSRPPDNHISWSWQRLHPPVAADLFNHPMGDEGVRVCPAWVAPPQSGITNS